MSSLPTQTPVYVPALTRQSVVVTDVDMSIVSMCRFMVKWSNWVCERCDCDRNGA